MGASPLSVTVDTESFQLSYFPHFTFLQSANMFTQCHGAYLRSCLLVYLMAGMLVQRVSPMRVMTTIKTETFWRHSRILGRRGVVVPCWTPCSGLFGGCQRHPNCFPTETAAVDQTWWAEQMEAMLCGKPGDGTDKALHPLVCSVNTETGPHLRLCWLHN